MVYDVWETTLCCFSSEIGLYSSECDVRIGEMQTVGYGRTSGLKPPLSPLFSGKAQVFVEKRARLINMEQELENRDANETFTRRFEAWQASFTKALESRSVLDIPVLPFQNTELTGKEYLALLSAMAENRRDTKRPLGGTGIMLLGGVFTALNLGTNLFSRRFYRLMKHFAFKPHMTYHESVMMFNTNKQQYVHNQARVVLEELRKQGLIEQMKGSVGWCEFETGDVIILTEKGKKVLADDPGFVEKTLKKLESQMNVTRDSKLEIESIPEAQAQPEQSAEARGKGCPMSPLFENMKRLFFSEKNDVNAWDLLQKLPPLFEKRPFYKRWFSPYLPVKDLAKKLGITDEKWLNAQLESLQVLGLMVFDHYYPNGWGMSENGKKAASKPDPFAAGLINREQFQRLMQYQIQQLEGQLEGHQTKLTEMSDTLCQAEADFAALVLAQASDGEKVQPILAERAQATKAHDIKRLDVTVELLAQKMRQRKALMLKQRQTCDQMAKQLEAGWERYAQLAKRTQDTVFELERLIQNSQRTEMANNLADIGESFQSLMSRQESVVAAAEAQLKTVDEEALKAQVRAEHQAAAVDVAQSVQEELARLLESTNDGQGTVRKSASDGPYSL